MFGGRIRQSSGEGEDLPPITKESMSEDKFVLKDSGQREQYEAGAVRDVRQGKGRFDLISPIALRRLAVVYEKGAEKYAPRNWEMGMPLGRFLDSALRHLNQYKEGHRDEDHLAQAMWNVACMIHFEETRPDLDDLPRYDTAPKNYTTSPIIEYKPVSQRIEELYGKLHDSQEAA
jgi:hypothetical protein